MIKGRSLSVLLPMLAAVGLTACGGHTNVSRAQGGCDEQITLSLAPGLSRTDRVIGELSKGAEVRLEYLRSSSPNLFVYRLTSKGKDPQCRNALARMRQDSHVRFAELDQRRSHYDAAR